MGKWRNESLNISVNAVLTKSFIKGRTNGKPGLHILFIRKSAVFSEKNEQKQIFLWFLWNNEQKFVLPMTLRPPNKSVIFNFKSSNLSISTRTLSNPPGPPTLVTLVVWLENEVSC